MFTNRCLMWKRNKFRTTVLALAWSSLALGLPLAGAGCGHKAEANGSEDAVPLVEVATINPQRKDVTREIDQPGYLRPYEETPIYTKIAGFAKEPRFDIGDRVKKGELLVDLYVPEVVQDLRVKAARVDQAKADLKQAKEAARAAKAGREAARADVQAKLAAIRSADAEVLRWQGEVDRARNLLAKGIYDKQTLDQDFNQWQSSVAKRDESKANHLSAQAIFDKASAHYDKSEADVDVAAASVAVAEANHDQWRDWLSYAQITAPYDGIVTLRNVHTGHFLQPASSGTTNKAAEPLFIMMRTDIMRCDIEVPEMDAVLVKERDKAIIHFQAMPGVETVGKVTRFSHTLNWKTRTLPVEVHLKNPDNVLWPGMYANVTILAKLRKAWTLPPEAIASDILSNGDRSYCFIVDNGKVHKTFLEIGAHGAEGVQVLRKLGADGKWEEITGKEAVVSTNPKALQDGQAVQLLAPDPH